MWNFAFLASSSCLYNIYIINKESGLLISVLLLDAICVKIAAVSGAKLGFVLQEDVYIRVWKL